MASTGQAGVGAVIADTGAIECGQHPGGEDQEDEDESWVCDVVHSRREVIGYRFEWVLYDTGSDEHLCAHTFGGQVFCLQDADNSLQGVSGDMLKTYDRETVEMQLADCPLPPHRSP